MRTNVVEDMVERAPVDTGVTVKLGMDVHSDQITVCRQVGGRVPQPAQVLAPAKLLEQVRELRAGGVTVLSCYEAGPCGYLLHRQLTALGVTNYVIAPQRLDERHRRVKTDKRDARELCNRLDRYSRGNTDAFSVVRVPTVEEERRRALTRQRGTVLKEQHRCVVRGHGLMLSQGVRAPTGWWHANVWPRFSARLPEWLRPHIARWQAQAISYEAMLAELTPQVEALMAGQTAPKGVGALTTAILESEVLDWHRFHNRREVGSYTGLCPSEHSSNRARRQGSVTKCGNRRLRHQLVEAVWRLLEWQPTYPPLQRIQAATGKRARKRAAVAVARRLAVDLWRLNTGQCSAQRLGLTLLRH
ncbi:IS110 family transposase [Opitutus sp. ER46]|uniref:IS110 family transposase n=1 Tax=Opitutus sp. ER46 TaxID=2161864 RepID=UPI000D301D26|nr:IS110 family transposase [Opitutus sp. ER46]PTY01423.1 IS110 family transposase [Opitutus sp. ER46]